MAEAAEDQIANRMSAILHPVEEAPVEAPVEAPAEEASAEEAEEVTEEATEEPIEAVDDDVPTVSNFTELAAHLNLSPDELFQTPVAIDVDGTRQEVTVEALKTAYVANDRLEKRAAEIGKMREEVTAIREQARAESERRVLESVAILESIESRFMSDAKAIDWNALRQDDPSEWSAKRQEMIERRQQIDSDKARVSQAYNQHVAERKTATEEQSQELLARERQKMLDGIPAWNDEARMKADIVEMREYLGGYGFTAREIDGLSDHRIVLLLHRAGVLSKQSANVDATKKRLVKIGSKVMKPGSATTKTKTSRSETEQIRTRLKKSGSVDDFAAYLSASNKAR